MVLPGNRLRGPDLLATHRARPIRSGRKGPTMTAAQDRKEVLVLIAGDVGLRSVLVARLSLQGETVITFDDAVQFLAATRLGPRPAVLIIEVSGAGQHDHVFAHHPWDLILGLHPPGEAAAGDGAIVRLEHGEALIRIPEVLADWRRAREAAE
jgi:hypothetical protein